MFSWSVGNDYTIFAITSRLPVTDAEYTEYEKLHTADGEMLINQHDTSWQDDLPTRVDEVGNFLIYILHGATCTIW